MSQANVILRELSENDVPFMLEWMHDLDFQKCFQKNMMKMTYQQAHEFVLKSKHPTDLSTCHGKDLHFAISEKVSNEYLGTISLKHIDLLNRNAEYAIVVRKKAQGNGIALRATQLLIEYAFSVLKLHKIYLNVYSENERANKFYQKVGFIYEGCSKDHVMIDQEFKDLNWYGFVNAS